MSWKIENNRVWQLTICNTSGKMNDKYMAKVYYNNMLYKGPWWFWMLT